MTKTYSAIVYFTKETQPDDWEHGCTGGYTLVCDDSFAIEFNDTTDLLNGLANWITSRFDVNKEKFIEWVNNEIENNRFDYNQNEDSKGSYMEITEENKEGYLSDYTFDIRTISKIVTDYKFDEKHL